MNISLIGFMGTGKSTVGEELAERLDYTLVDLDQEIVKREGREISEIFATDGEEYFRDLEAKVTAEVAQRDNQIISTGGGVVLRDENTRNLKEKGVVVLLKATPKEILERITDDNQRPLLQVADPLAKIKEMLAARSDKYNCTFYQIDTSNLSIVEVVTEIITIVEDLGD